MKKRKSHPLIKNMLNELKQVPKSLNLILPISNIPKSNLNKLFVTYSHDFF